MGEQLNTMYLCIHALQVMPVSCVNRDDTGTPKSCIYGGSSRMRVSSQCWKRAMRMYLKDKYGDTGVRTKFIVSHLAERLVSDLDCEEKEGTDFVKESLMGAKLISEKKDTKDTSAFYSEEQIEALYQLIKKQFVATKTKKDFESPAAYKNKLAEAAKNTPSLSELLFGRMFATQPSLNYDAAAQVAHAFSVNEVREEPDYFTVVGDIQKEEFLSGSDFLETKLFSSGILYRFADVNFSKGSELRKECYKINIAKAASQFLEAFVLSMPTGSVNSYANATVPDFITVELRDDIPMSFAPAFVEAVERKDIFEASVEKLVSYQEKIRKLYKDPVRTWRLGEVSLSELQEQVADEISRRL